ncbi:hypothetical protein UDOIXSUF_CDS0198 [Staphylococcus phage PG-2021_1]|uniref:Baseplate hub assembly protein n=4 Tax=Caudoviricetes TaxID=2731619 RepID=A0AAX3Y223_9CAUD|nr:hypothetical protein 7AX1_199 [uncultured Caudovirales phage]AXY83976.1 hypothetical protein Terranova_093 [Staphylococcus phage Terranova]MDU7109287.1 hypothetical protein [Clostridium perfringens]QLF86820.1 hypothetical protein BESEP4_00086 [Staphylococcus phage vB_SepM_BE04]QLF87003.1 hypothetical protein BESEP5_00061 [Staphylococcus phage vB_SepM_BE05]WJJ57798.1 hypothetical protein 80A_00019 [Staphylococcus phage 80A]WJJ57991.1 hypothetical protein 80B_00019 [Staphylococcus phage 80B]
MAISSVDSYLLKEIKPRLRTVLDNCYIINEVLKDFDEQARNNFIESFCGKNAQHEITIGYNFPEFKTNHEAHYLIQLGQGQEVGTALGGVQGSYFENSNNTYVENSVAQREGDKLVFTVSNPIHSVINVDDVVFAKDDDMKVKDNKIYFNYNFNEDYEGYNAIITYVEKTDDTKGIVKGMNVEESITVVGLSYNVDVARCMDAVLRMILISMRDSIEEQQTFQLQKLSFGDLAPIIDNGSDYIFGRPTIISYTSSSDLDYTITQEINKITFKERAVSNGTSKENN